MKSINLHCDTLLRAAQQQGPEADLLHCPDFQVDLARMRQGGMDVNFFAIFLPPETHLKAMGLDTYAAYIDLLAGIFDRNMERHKDLIAPVRCTRDIEHNRSRSLMSGVLTMEDGVAVYGRRENLEHFYAMGVRALSLTWNFENCFGFPNSPDPAQMALGLKPFGRDMVVYMQELGMLVDVSHLNDGGFWEVLRLCRKPVMATHSNCRALSPHPRNLTDEMLRALADNGGVAGLNFYGCFLNGDIHNSDSTAEGIARHARHMLQTAGEDVIAIGTDFDGISGRQQIRDCAQLSLLERALEKEGFTPRQVEKIFSGNAMRVMAESMH